MADIKAAEITKAYKDLARAVHGFTARETGMIQEAIMNAVHAAVEDQRAWEIEQTMTRAGIERYDFRN